MDDFKSKPINPPILDSQTKERIFPQSRINRSFAIGRFYRANKWYVWAIAAALVVIAVLAYLAFHKRTAAPTKDAAVNVSIDVPETVPSSGEFIFRVKIDNQDPSKLVGMELEMVYPQGAAYVSSSPSAKNASGTLFAVPDLSTGQNAVITLKANMQGGINDTKQILARLRYHYANFNSGFEKVGTATVRLVASDIILEVQGPDTAVPSQPAAYTIKYTNNSDHDIQNARIEAEYPDNFTFVQSSPPSDLGKNTWNISKLPTGQTGSISITGNFTGSNSGESKTISVQFLVLDQSGNFFTQATADFTSQISTLPLVASQGLDQDTGVAKPGAVLGYTVNYKNNASNPARGVNVVVTLDSKALDLNSIKAEGALVSGSTITWNAASTSALEVLDPNQGGTLRYSVSVKNPATKDTSKNLTVKSSVKIKSDEYDTFLPGNTVETKISSPASLGSALAYSSGSLPPRVGQDTVYKASLSLRNATNDIVSSQLALFISIDPSSFDIQSVNAKEKSATSFDKSTGKLVWNVGTLSAHSGDFNPPRTLEFSLRLHPTSAQAGSEVTLVRNISFFGKDGFTSQNISLTAEDITTQDLPDDGTHNYGTVAN